jgi:hypothetical protein
LRVKKKSELAASDIAPEAAAAVLPEAPAPAGQSAEQSGKQEADAPPPQEDEGEENIYEVMKGHMRRQKEELEARNAAMRQQAGRMGGRPGPAGQSREPAKPTFDKVRDVTDLHAVWAATRNYLASVARYLDSVLGHCCSVGSLNPETGEAVLLVPATQRGFTNEKARAKIEEALRVVTGLGIRLTVEFSQEEQKAPPPADGSQPGVAGVAANRVPAEVLEAIKQQKVVQELMKKLDASVTNVEMLGTGEE